MILSPSMTPERLDDATLDLQDRARRFTDEVLIPLEVEAEMATGKRPAAPVERVKSEALAAGLTGGLHAKEHGGQGWTRLQWALVAEQFGRSTNAIHWHVPNGYNVWAHGSPEQIDRYLRPLLRGEIRDAYAVTEAEAGSDPSRIASVAVSDGNGGFRLSGEKWFVTSGDVASVLIVMANVVDGDERLPTLFLVEVEAPGVPAVEDPRFTHSYPDGHPTFRFDGVALGADAIVGGVGAGEDLQ